VTLIMFVVWATSYAYGEWQNRGYQNSESETHEGLNRLLHNLR